MYVSGVLKTLQKEHPEIEIEPIDIVTNLNRWKEASVKVFPALKIGDAIKAWYLLDRKEIVEFVQGELKK